MQDSINFKQLLIQIDINGIDAYLTIQEAMKLRDALNEVLWKLDD